MVDLQEGILWKLNLSSVANKHYLTVTEEHFEMAAATDTQNRDEIWGQTGDKRGTQPPATPRTALQKKSQFVISARENTCFSDIVGILENTLIAEEGLELVVVFSGKSYILSKVGDKRGIISAKEKC